MTIRTMIAVDHIVWDYIRKNKILGETHNDFLKRVFNYFNINSRVCEECNQRFLSVGMELVEDRWLCKCCKKELR